MSSEKEVQGVCYSHVTQGRHNLCTYIDWLLSFKIAKQHRHWQNTIAEHSRLISTPWGYLICPQGTAQMFVFSSHRNDATMTGNRTYNLITSLWQSCNQTSSLPEHLWVVLVHLYKTPHAAINLGHSFLISAQALNHTIARQVSLHRF